MATGQEQDKREDLTGDAALERLREMIKDSSLCFFCTGAALGPSRGVRPMGVERIDDDGTLWFLSADDSSKNRELAQDDGVELFFLPGKTEFLHLMGRAIITRDAAIIDALWQPMHRTWFNGGREDPRITAIGVRPERGYYWDTRHGTAVAGVKMMIGAALRRPIDDSVEGTLRV
jgi:general stress protein 26